jgi:hypothetical protein
VSLSEAAYAHQRENAIYFPKWNGIISRHKSSYYQ